MTTDLFYGNTFILFLIFTLSVSQLDKINERQKIAVIYVCSYGIAITESVSDKLLLVTVLVSLLLVQEYFTFDQKKLVILKKFSSKFLDFVYMTVFQYKILLFILAITIRTSFIKAIFLQYDKILDLLSIGIFLITFTWMFNVPEDFASFSEMYEILSKTPYRSVIFNEKLKCRLDLIVAFEDRLYWERSKSYTSVSFEYINAWYKDRKDRRIKQSKRHCCVRRLIRKPNKYVLRRLLAEVKANTIMRINELKRICGRICSIFKRGHSTIPMQLIRIMGYKHGLVFGNSYVRYKSYRILKRKIFEVIYAHIFFIGLKDYLKTELCKEVTEYKEYLVYLYPQIVQTIINGKTYRPAKEAFWDADTKRYPPMAEWNKNRFVDMCYGFSPVGKSEKRIAIFRVAENEFLHK